MSAKPTDHELRLRALKLTNAFDQQNLALRPVHGQDQLTDIINIYEHAGWPAEKVYCSKCYGPSP